jgi:hypothetical protein
MTSVESGGNCTARSIVWSSLKWKRSTPPILAMRDTSHLRMLTGSLPPTAGSVMNRNEANVA